MPRECWIGGRGHGGWHVGRSGTAYAGVVGRRRERRGQGWQKTRGTGRVGKRREQQQANKRAAYC